MRRLAYAVAMLVIIVGCGGGAPAVSPAGTPALTLQLGAQNSLFSTRELSVAADVIFAVELDNKDSLPHNFAVAGKQSGEIFTGPQIKTSVFNPLPAGSYRFQCDVHPEMNGTLTVN